MKEQEDKVDHPHLVWWVVVIGGLSLLGVQAFSESFYTWWVTHLHPLPSQTVMMWILIACAPIHVFEAFYCHWLARRIGLVRSAVGWGVQSFFLGYPSTRLLRQRAKASAASKPGKVEGHAAAEA